MSSDDLKQSGGPLVYWEQARRTRPQLARMALDFLSAPGMILDFLHRSKLAALYPVV
jgi:hypothetical protein